MRITAKRKQGGFTVLELLIVIGVIAILASVAIPNYTASQKSANEASAIASMRAIVTAEENYRVKQNPPKYGVLHQLKDSGLIHPSLGSGSKSGYTFITFGIPGNQTYAFVGHPQTGMGDRCFYVDQSGVVRASKDGSADPTSSPLD